MGAVKERVVVSSSAPTCRLEPRVSTSSAIWRAERERVPLIFVNGQFAGMPQVVLDESCRAGVGEAGLEIRLRDLREPSD